MQAFVLCPEKKQGFRLASRMGFLLSPFDEAPTRLFLNRRYFLPRPGPYPDTRKSRSGHSSATIHSRSKTRCHPFEHGMPAFFAVAPRISRKACGAFQSASENACTLGVKAADRSAAAAPLPQSSANLHSIENPLRVHKAGSRMKPEGSAAGRAREALHARRMARRCQYAGDCLYFRRHGCCVDALESQ